MTPIAFEDIAEGQTLFITAFSGPQGLVGMLVTVMAIDAPFVVVSGAAAPYRNCRWICHKDEITFAIPNAKFVSAICDDIVWPAEIDAPDIPPRHFDTDKSTF